MSFIMGVEIKWDWFVLPVSGFEANIGLIISTDVSFAGWACEYLSSAGIMGNDIDFDIFWSLSGNLIWKFDDFSWFLIKLETELSGRDTKVNGRNLTEKKSKTNYH